ncbi:MAG: hypothetical protein Q7R96_06125 [Nanoarchaeota archaeon]|nr:hypothetical protein [Nanoarchaeota archaeon]
MADFLEKIVAADDAILKSAQSVLRKYNWLTGGDKYDLFRDMATIIPVVMGSELALESKNVFCGAGVATAVGVVSYVFHKFIVRPMEKADEETRDANVLSLDYHDNKGLVGAARISNLVYAAMPPYDTGIRIFNFGYFAACSFLLVDNIPRRKSLFSRTKERLTNLLKKQQPVLAGA